jgi:UDP-3-O-[3-hydroxymyristoyl] glucosamine N-acyltransferase
MEINVSRYSDKHSFGITGASYIGAPRSNTAMFVSKKVGQLISALSGVKQCLVFAEEGLEVPDSILANHCFVFSDNPQGAYAAFTEAFFDEEETNHNRIGYTVTDNGAYISKTAKIGDNAVIEPGVVIGPGVIIGERARIYSGAVIKNAVIGDHAIINEKAVIGANGFTMANDENGNKIRIYSLGRVIIGDNVEIGTHDNISRGSGGDTVIEDNVKIDALIHIGHDVHLHKNVEITAGAVVGGFVDAKESAYIGINSVIRNRVTLGAHCFIGMGATVTKSVPEGITVVGNPAKPFEKK